jgi:hypothetical protein
MHAVICSSWSSCSSYSSLVVPAGVTLEDAHDVHPSRNVLDNHPAIAQHADIFRYHLLYKYGGWWVDTDVYCLTGNLPVQPYAWAEQEPGVLNNAILKFPKGDALCGELLAAALASGRTSQSRRKGRRLCGAKTRVGGCQVRAEPGKARCRFHGGKSTGPKTQAGRARIARPSDSGGDIIERGIGKLVPLRRDATRKHPPTRSKDFWPLSYSA